MSASISRNQLFTLSNGLRVVTVEMPHKYSVELVIHVKTGSCNDPKGKAGLSHFIEHMLFQGTDIFSTTFDLDVAFESIGGSINASTDNEFTSFQSRVHPDHVSEGIKYFSSILLSPTFNNLKREKNIVLEEALGDLNEFNIDINPCNVSAKLLWPGHALGEPTIGTKETIESFSVSDIIQYMGDFYTPDNVVLVACGRIKSDQVIEAAEKYFGNWKGKSKAGCSVPINIQNSSQTAFIKDPGNQIEIQFAFRSFSRRNKKVETARFINRIFCGNGSSRMHANLREEKGLVYSIGAITEEYEDTGMFAVEFLVAPENLYKSVSEVFKEITRICKEPIPDIELERVKRNIFFELDFARDEVHEMTERYGIGELVNNVRHIEDDQAMVSSITKDQIISTALDLFHPCNLNLVAIGPVNKREIILLQKQIKDYASAW